MPSNTFKKPHNAASVLGVVSWPQNGGNRHASFTFAITTAPTPILGVAFRLPKWELILNRFFSYFNIDVETKTSGPTLKIKPSHSSFQSFRTCNQTFFHKSLIFSPKRQTGDAPSNGSSSVINFNSHFWSCCLAIFESKNKNIKALAHLSWMTFPPLCWPMLTLLPSPHRAMLWYAAECGQRPFESSKVHASRSFKVWQLECFLRTTP